MEQEKVYITRDEGDNFVFVWRKPTKGNWAPEARKKIEVVNYDREDSSNRDCYALIDFEKKFGMKIKEKANKCVHLSVDLLNSQDYRMISNDKDRKK
jgi:hypothetical protein